MKIDSIQLIKQSDINACWDLYVNGSYVGIYVPDSQTFTLRQTSLGVPTECRVSITGSVYPKIVEDEFRETFTDIVGGIEVLTYPPLSR